MRAWQRQLLVGAPVLLTLVLLLRLPGLGGTLGGFDNDHFGVLVRANELREGRWPLTHFGDYELRGIWPPMTYAVPAAGAALFGDNLLTEAALTLLALWLAAVLTSQVALHLGASVPAAIGVAVAQILISPRLYNYPKLVILAAAAAALLWYARSPNRVSPALALGTVGAVGFLFRHDLGFYVALGALFVLAARAHDSGIRMAARSAAHMALPAVMLVLPGLVVAERAVGLVAYLQRSLTLTGQEVGRAQPQPAMFELGWRPLVRVDPPPASVPPRIRVRWVENLDVQRRGEAETRLALRDGEALEDRTWGYEVSGRPGELAELVADPLVEDTHGFDRTTFELDRETVGANIKLLRLFDRVHLFPGVLHRDNALAWLYWLIVSIPVAVLLSLAYQWTQRRRGPPTSENASGVAAIGAMAVVAIVVNTMFLRQPIAERLPDVLVLPSILFAWGFTLSWRHGHGTARSVRRSLLALTVTVSALSAFAVGEGGARVRYVIEEGPGRLLRNARLAVTSMHGLPGEATADANGDLVRTARYVRACTVPSDRMMVGANLSPLYYFAERGFAGGQLAYFSGFYTSLPEQREILDTLTGESVPIVLLPDPPTEFLEDYALVAEHLQARYRTVGLLGQEPRMQVWVDRSRSVVRTHAVSGLPCFR